MSQKSGTPKMSSERIVKDIRRATRKQYSAEEKIRIVLDGLRGEHSIAELCRREGIYQRVGPWRSLASLAPPFTDGATSTRPAGRKPWKIDLPGRSAYGIASPAMSVAKSCNWPWTSRSYRHGNLRHALRTQKTILSRRLLSIACSRSTI